MNKPTKKQKIEMLEIANAFLKAEIAEFEKEQAIRDLEQEAKGVKRVLCENSLSLVKRERMVLKRIMKQLHEKANALKEQE
tara:strand:- start:766 stop:1008 length:243 start_codon:yes stop_codon:yes gene_type:complete